MLLADADMLLRGCLMLGCYFSRYYADAARSIVDDAILLAAREVFYAVYVDARLCHTAPPLRMPRHIELFYYATPIRLFFAPLFLILLFSCC